MATLLLENEARRRGCNIIAGIDEAGRGPLAGPVVAACVVLNSFNFTARIYDSKCLTPLSRQRAYFQILERARVGIGIVYEDEIKAHNIHRATITAMKMAVFDLAIKPDVLLVDGRMQLALPFRQISVINGDKKSLSIAAASIVAKVVRDKLMRFYDNIFPKYDFARHKGYGTGAHFKAIARHGLSPLHRRDFIHI